MSRHARIAELRERLLGEGLMRRTWLPAVFLVTLLMIGGFMLQRALPEADSVGDVLRALAR